MKIFLILIFRHFFTQSTIVFPFKKNKTEYNEEKDTDFFYYLFKRIYVNVSIGTPNQIIPTFLDFGKNTFYFSAEENKIYNNLISSSYKQLQPNKSFSNEYFRFGNYSSESFILKNEKNKEINVNNLTFYLVSNHRYSSLKSGELGLRISYNSKIINSSFIYQLKQKNIIKNIVFSLIFNNNYEGKLIIGSYPHEYNSKKFKKENLKLTKAEFNKENVLWITKFDKVFFGDNIINEHIHDFIFRIEHSNIISNTNFFLQCNKTFFKDYLNNNKCFVGETKLNDYFYYCNDDVDITKFPSLKFEHKVWNFTFELTYEDLFIKFGNKYYLLIIFERYYSNLWTLGDIFLRKYNFVFDNDNKVIGFYLPILFKINFLFYVVLIFLILCFVILIYLYFHFLCKKKRKIRNNEIDEIYDYLPN